MQTTGNLGLKKPEGTDIVDIADLNGNMDILDNVVNGKVDKVAGKQLSTNDYTAAEKTKLAGITAGANNYAHPNHTGDITSTGDGVTAIAAGVIVDADVNSSAAIAWTKLSKTGASLADLPTRSAADLSSGTLAAARLPAISGDITIAAGGGTAAITAGAIVNADVNAAAAIDASKIGTGVVSNTEFGYLDGVSSGIQGQLNGKETPTGAQEKADAAIGALKSDYIRQPGYAATSGTAIAYNVVLTPAPTTIPDGFGITIVPHVTNGVNPTLSVNGLAATSLKDQKGITYAAGKLIAGKPYMFRRVGTDFLADSAGGSGNAVAGDIRAGRTAATDAGDITGTLPVQTGGTVTPGATAVVKPAGIYDAAITVSAVSVPAAKVLSDTTIAGTKGTIPIANPTVSTHLTTTQVSYGAYSGDGVPYLYLGIPNGYYLNGVDWARFREPNFQSQYFRSDVNMFGVQGTMPVINVGDDPAMGVGRWGDGALAVYPREGYRKGGSGAGEIKVSPAQLASVGFLYAGRIALSLSVPGNYGWRIPVEMFRTPAAIYYVSMSGNGNYTRGDGGTWPMITDQNGTYQYLGANTNYQTEFFGLFVDIQARRVYQYARERYSTQDVRTYVHTVPDNFVLNGPIVFQFCGNGGSTLFSFTGNCVFA